MFAPAMNAGLERVPLALRGVPVPEPFDAIEDRELDRDSAGGLNDGSLVFVCCVVILRLSHSDP